MNLPVNQTRYNFPDYPDHPVLQDSIARYASALPGLAGLGKQLQDLSQSSEAGRLNTLIDLYELCYPLLEKTMWSDGAVFLCCWRAIRRCSASRNR